MLKLLFGIILFLAALITFFYGIVECYEIFYLKQEATGMQFALAIVKIFPVSEILFVIGVMFCFASAQDNAMSKFQKKRRIL